MRIDANSIVGVKGVIRAAQEIRTVYKSFDFYTNYDMNLTRI